MNHQLSLAPDAYSYQEGQRPRRRRETGCFEVQAYEAGRCVDGVGQPFQAIEGYWNGVLRLHDRDAAGRRSRPAPPPVRGVIQIARGRQLATAGPRKRT
jgi:hypothetical protein